MTEKSDNKVYQLKDDLGSWELINWKVIAATTDLEVPKEYEWYWHLFNQPEQPELPMHDVHDHMIPLKEGKEPTCKRIYPILEKELQALCDYITDQLQKGNI